MVRLKVYKSAANFIKQVYFNSTMVRLKGTASTDATLVGTTFQFHYGTIKSSSQTPCR